MNSILRRLPLLEVIVRTLYWRSKFFHRLVGWAAKKNMSTKKSCKSENSKYTKQDFVNLLVNSGLQNGDVVIVHSSFSELKRFNVSPDEVINAFIEVLGEGGTIIMPGIPILKSQPNPIDRFDIRNYREPAVYDVQKSKMWTGALPQALLKRAGARRSRSPLNSMIVLGSKVDFLVDNESFGEKSLPCDENSVLGRAFRLNAKILFLGVDEVHSMTSIHIAEDMFAEEWPIDNWYWSRDFTVIDGDYSETLRLRERNPKWALFYAERRFSSDLLNAGILKREFFGSLIVSVCCSSDLIEFLKRKNTKTGYPYQIPFWYRKRFQNKNIHLGSDRASSPLEP